MQRLFPSIEDFKNERRDERRQSRAAVDPGTVRSWGDPAGHTEIVGADIGGGVMHLHRLYAGEDVEGIALSDVLGTLAGERPGTLFVIESAHLAVAQTEQSLSQSFTAGQLQEIYRACEAAGVTLRLFSESCTRRARDWTARNGPAGFVDAEKGSDINDARAIAYYVANGNGISLAKPPGSFVVSRRREFGRKVVEASNVVLNAARRSSYAADVFPHISALAEKLVAVGGPCENFIGNTITAYTVAAMVLHRDNRRFTYLGNAPGWRLWKECVAKMSPFHQRGGIGRSNYCFWRFRSFFASFANGEGVAVKDGQKLIAFGALDNEQDAVRRAAWKQARDHLKAAYLEAVRLTADRPGFEILDAKEGGEG
jgi:hypothetical protein